MLVKWHVYIEIGQRDSLDMQIYACCQNFLSLRKDNCKIRLAVEMLSSIANEKCQNMVHVISKNIKPD